MKRLLHGFVISLSVITGPALAETVTYACQYVKSGGLTWEQGQWKATAFKTKPPFFLKTQNGSLTLESVWQVFFPGQFDRSKPYGPVCTPVVFKNQSQSCTDGFGNTIRFSATDLSGTAAKLFLTEGARTLSVAPFVCTRF